MAALRYDANGNPLSYYNGQNYTFTWEKGRQLASAVTGSNTMTFGYDVNGQRISKTVNGTTHTYTYDGTLLICDKWGSQYIEYFYDASGSPYALNYYNGSTSTKYYFVKNIEGDILELRSGTNTLVARYIYDGWGKLLEVRDASGNAITSSTHIANLNSLRYRGYFYDTETKLYYLQSRYYDPQVQRFISSDVYVSTGQGIIGHNMFTYCNNCPSVYIDVSGCFFLPFDLLDYPGEIHSAVLTHIENCYPNMFVIVDSQIPGSLLRPDLVDNEGGVYELKPVTWITKKDLIYNQIFRYINEEKRLSGACSKYKIGTKTFRGRFPYMNFIVQYWSDPEANGIIYYSFRKINSPELQPSTTTYPSSVKERTIEYSYGPAYQRIPIYSTGTRNIILGGGAILSCAGCIVCAFGCGWRINEYK